MRYPRYKQAELLLSELKLALSALVTDRIIKTTNGFSESIDSLDSFRMIESLRHRLGKIGALGQKYSDETRHITTAIEEGQRYYFKDVSDLKLSLIPFVINHTEKFIQLGLKRSEETYVRFDLNRHIEPKLQRVVRIPLSKIAVDRVLAGEQSSQVARDLGLSSQTVSAALRARGFKARELRKRNG